MTSKVLNPIEIKEEYEKTPSLGILSKRYNTTCRNIRKHLLLGGGAINFRKVNTINYKVRDTHFVKGRTPWNKGMRMNESFCKMRSENVKQQVANGTFYYPSKHSEVAEKIRLGKLGNRNPMYGKTGILSPNYGEASGNWLGGKTFENYPREFSKSTKLRILERDNFTCQICKLVQNQLKKTLHIHHIDYNKKNCNDHNLISLCNSCHIKTNFNRDYWQQHFTKLLGRI